MTTPASYRQGSTWLQTSPVDFNHSLTGADRTDERISEIPELTIPFPGVWEISYHARSYTGGTAAASCSSVLHCSRTARSSPALEH
ncbi:MULTISPECIES: hypothetical protein [unclassified Streptomyces]|uniref:hypothetical protein n=1 Tax=unclassified Streptomyces TaxID=2593676 RepID=UPI00131C7086|nr:MULTISPECIES: hypothetical protein [unclassified Streptomyces]